MSRRWHSLLPVHILISLAPISPLYFIIGTPLILLTRALPRLLLFGATSSLIIFLKNLLFPSPGNWLTIISPLTLFLFLLAYYLVTTKNKNRARDFLRLLKPLILGPESPFLLLGLPPFIIIPLVTPFFWRVLSDLGVYQCFKSVIIDPLVFYWRTGGARTMVTACSPSAQSCTPPSTMSAIRPAATPSTPVLPQSKRWRSCHPKSSRKKRPPTLAGK